MPKLPPPNFEPTTLAILAGGEGSRMGFPKGQLKLNGRPILDQLLDQLAWPGPTLLVTAPHRLHPPGWQRFTREVVDPTPNGGPLRGVLTALENLLTPLLLVLTVDMPGVQPTHCQYLLDALRQRPLVAGLMLIRPLNNQQQIEPFPLVLRATVRPIVAGLLQANRRSVHGLLRQEEFIALDAPAQWPASVWHNLNTPADLTIPQTPSQPEPRR